MTKLSPVSEKGHENCIATEFNPILWGSFNQTVLWHYYRWKLEARFPEYIQNLPKYPFLVFMAPLKRIFLIKMLKSIGLKEH